MYTTHACNSFKQLIWASKRSNSWTILIKTIAIFYYCSYPNNWPTTMWVIGCDWALVYWARCCKTSGIESNIFVTTYQWLSKKVGFLTTNLISASSLHRNQYSTRQTAVTYNHILLVASSRIIYMSPPRYLKLKERDFIFVVPRNSSSQVVFWTSSKPWADCLRIPFTDTGVRLTKLPWSLPATSRKWCI